MAARAQKRTEMLAGRRSNATIIYPKELYIRTTTAPCRPVDDDVYCVDYFLRSCEVFENEKYQHELSPGTNKT